MARAPAGSSRRGERRSRDHEPIRCHRDVRSEDDQTDAGHRRWVLLVKGDADIRAGTNRGRRKAGVLEETALSPTPPEKTKPLASEVFVSDDELTVHLVYGRKLSNGVVGLGLGSDRKLKVTRRRATQLSIFDLTLQPTLTPRASQLQVSVCPAREGRERLSERTLGGRNFPSPSKLRPSGHLSYRRIICQRVSTATDEQDEAKAISCVGRGSARA